MNIKMSLSAFMVVLDTLYGSTAVKDNGQLFRYSYEQRETVFRALEETLKSISVNVEVIEKAD